MEEKAHQWLAVSTHLITFIWRCIDYFPITCTLLITSSGTLSTALARKITHITATVALHFQTAKFSTLAIQEHQTTTVNYTLARSIWVQRTNRIGKFVIIQSLSILHVPDNTSHSPKPLHTLPRSTLQTHTSPTFHTL